MTTHPVVLTRSGSPPAASFSHRYTALVAVSRAPLATLEAYAKRLGWTFRWVSSGESDFNFDYKVSSRPVKTRWTIISRR